MYQTSWFEKCYVLNADIYCGLFDSLKAMLSNVYLKGVQRPTAFAMVCFGNFVQSVILAAVQSKYSRLQAKHTGP